MPFFSLLGIGQLKLRGRPRALLSTSIIWNFAIIFLWQLQESFALFTTRAITCQWLQVQFGSHLRNFCTKPHKCRLNIIYCRRISFRWPTPFNIYVQDFISGNEIKILSLISEVFCAKMLINSALYSYLSSGASTTGWHFNEFYISAAPDKFTSFFFIAPATTVREGSA